MSTKEVLLDCGLALFSKASYDCVGVQEIVDAANVTKPTLYHHFGSKLGFYEAVYNAHIQTWFDTMIPKAHYEGDLVKNLNQLAICAVEHFISNEAAYRMFEFSLNVSKTSESYDFVREHLRSFLRDIWVMFDKAVEQHGNLRGKTNLCTWHFMCILRAEILLVLNKYEEYTPDLPYKIVHQFMYGIFA
ncbi:MAG: TetR/AcrR family transcriptional regulator [Proteobacteria bacterium]|nr:TetR/AcrR family transcriptional regulator [Pseudomonadota bacterium]